MGIQCVTPSPLSSTTPESIPSQYNEHFAWASIFICFTPNCSNNISHIVFLFAIGFKGASVTKTFDSEGSSTFNLFVKVYSQSLNKSSEFLIIPSSMG